MPQPQILSHTTPKSFWKISMPHGSGKYYRLYYTNELRKIISYYFSDISVKWLKVKQLREELADREIIMVGEKENRTEIIRILEDEIAKKGPTEKIGRFKKSKLYKNAK